MFFPQNVSSRPSLKHPIAYRVPLPFEISGLFVLFSRVLVVKKIDLILLSPVRGNKLRCTN